MTTVPKWARHLPSSGPVISPHLDPSCSSVARIRLTVQLSGAMASRPMAAHDSVASCMIEITQALGTLPRLLLIERSSAQVGSLLPDRNTSVNDSACLRKTNQVRVGGKNLPNDEREILHQQQSSLGPSSSACHLSGKRSMASSQSKVYLYTLAPR